MAAATALGPVLIEGSVTRIHAVDVEPLPVQYEFTDGVHELLGAARFE